MFCFCLGNLYLIKNNQQKTQEKYDHRAQEEEAEQVAAVVEGDKEREMVICLVFSINFTSGKRIVHCFWSFLSIA